MRALTSDGCNEQIQDNNTDCGQDFSVYADVVLRLGDPRGAIDRGLVALRFDANEWPVHATLAWAYGQIGDLDHARSELALYRSAKGADRQTVEALETAVNAGSVPTPSMP